MLHPPIPPWHRMMPPPWHAMCLLSCAPAPPPASPHHILLHIPHSTRSHVPLLTPRSPLLIVWCYFLTRIRRLRWGRKSYWARVNGSAPLWEVFFSPPARCRCACSYRRTWSFAFMSVLHFHYYFLIFSPLL